MSIVTAKVLAEAQFGVTSPVTALYTAPAATRTIVDKMTATNIDASTARTVTVNIVPSGGSAGSDNTITSVLSIAANTAVDLTEIKNHILAAGDAIWVTAGTANKIVVRLSGREIV